MKKIWSSENGGITKKYAKHFQAPLRHLISYIYLTNVKRYLSRYKKETDIWYMKKIWLSENGGIEKYFQAFFRHLISYIHLTNVICLVLKKKKISDTFHVYISGELIDFRIGKRLIYLLIWIFTMIRVDLSWSDPEWWSELIRSDFCTWRIQTLWLTYTGQLTACRVSRIFEISGFKAQIFTKAKKNNSTKPTLIEWMKETQTKKDMWRFEYLKLPE